MRVFPSSRAFACGIAVTICVVWTGAVSFAQPFGPAGDRPMHPRPPGMRPPGMPGLPGPRVFLERHAADLGIDDATRAKIEAVLDRVEPRMREIRERAHEEHRVMRGILDGDDPEVDEVMRQADKIGAIELEERKLRLRSMLEIRELLTPAQRTELRKRRDEMFERMSRGGPDAWVPPPCREDAETICADLPDGAPAMACLRGSGDRLSDDCRQMLERLERWRSRDGRPKD